MPFILKEHEEDQDFKDFITAQIKTATDALSNKKDELLGEIKVLKKSLKGAPNAEKLAELQAAQEKLTNIEKESLEKNGEYEKLLGIAQTQHKDELAAKDAKIGALDKKLRKRLVEGDLLAELNLKNVNPHLAEAAVRLLAPEVSVIEKDDDFVAMVGEKTIKERVAEWAMTDAGKNFILAGDNGGGGPEGNGGGGSGSNEYEKYFDPKSKEFNKTKQVEIYRSDLKVYNEMINKFQE